TGAQSLKRGTCTMDVGRGTWRNIMPSTVVPRMPHKIAPRTRRASSAPVISVPTSARSGPGAVMSPKATSVAGSSTTMPAAHGQLQRVRHRVHDGFPNAAPGENREDDTGNEDGAQRGFPRNAPAEYDGEREVGVEAHARREGERIVGQKRHQDGGEGRRYGR